MSRSVSVVEEIAPKPLLPAPIVVGAPDPQLTEKRSASETDLLSNCGERGSGAGAAAAAGCDTSAAAAAATGPQEGFYKSFADDIDDIDDLASGGLASSNPLEAPFLVLRKEPPPCTSSSSSSAASSEATSADTAARCSFNSNDSGRVSNDTYAETSNSSVASAASNSTSSHCNRLCSNISYCSADDSGMSSSNGCSNSDNGAGNTRLEALRERSEEKLQSFEKAAPVKCESAYSQIEDGEARYEYDTGFQIEILKVY